MLNMLRYLAGVIFVLLLVVSVEAEAQNVRRMTNAQRLARGLPPNKPILRRTPASGSKNKPSAIPKPPQPPPQPSPSCGNITGYIQAGKAGWYLDNSPGGQFNITDNATEAGSFKLDPCVPSPFALSCLNCLQAQTWPYVGIAVQPSGPGNNFGPKSGTVGYISLTSQTQNSPSYDGSKSFPADSSGKSQHASESNVWTYNTTSKALNLTWIDDNNAREDVYVQWSNNTLSVTGDYVDPPFIFTFVAGAT